MNRTIITVVGKDTIGIIAKVCTYLADKHINIMDISQTVGVIMGSNIGTTLTAWLTSLAGIESSS